MALIAMWIGCTRQAFHGACDGVWTGKSALDPRMQVFVRARRVCPVLASILVFREVRVGDGRQWAGVRAARRSPVCAGGGNALPAGQDAHVPGGLSGRNIEPDDDLGGEI